MHRKVAAALVAALALAVASCGGSEPQLSRAELVRRIEVACREGRAATTKASRENRESNSFAAAVSSGQHVMMDKIGNLNPPPAAKADFEAMKSSMQQRLELVDKVKNADRAAVDKTLREVQPTVEAASRRVQELQRRLGIEGCF